MRRLGLIALLLMAATAALIAVARRWGEPKTGDEGAAVFRYDWKPGKAYVYSLAVDAENQTALMTSAPLSGAKPAKSSLRGDLHLDGELVVRWRGVSGEDPVLGFRLRRLGNVRFRLLDRDVFADDAAARQALEEVEVLVVASARGEPKSLRFDPQASGIAKNLLQMLVGELQAIGPEDGAGRAWSLAEANQHGTARVRYEVTSANEQEIALGKQMESYITLRIAGGAALPEASRQEIEGGAQIRLSPAGHLLGLSLSERLRVQASDGSPMLDAKTAIEQTLLRIESDAQAPLSQASLATNETRRLDQVVLAKDAERKMLEQQADGIRMTELLDGIRGYVSGRGGAEHNRWLWRAVGLLRLEPDLCQELVGAFGKDSNIGRRALLLDLFSAAGHEQAQAAMVDMLRAAEGTVPARDYGMMLQRFSFVSAPTAESGEFLFERYQAASGDLKTAATYTLGSIAGGLERAGESDLAREYLSALEADLQSASKAAEREALILGLGNAKRTQSAGVLAGYAADPDARVRTAVAEALRDTQTQQSESVLLGLLSDPDPRVQQVAVRSLGSYQLSPEHFARLRDSIVSGSVSAASYPSLMALLISRPADPSSAEIAAYMLAHSADRPDLQPQLRQLVAALGP